MRTSRGRARFTTPLRWVALAILVAGCVPKVEQPDVWLSSARLVSLGIRGGVVDVELGVYNPNRFVVRAAGLTFDLDFEDAGSDRWLDFAEGRLEETVQVQPGDTARVVIPVEFSYRSLDGAIREMLTRGSFDYRVSGLVAVEEPIVRDIRYRHSGAVTPGGVR